MRPENDAQSVRIISSLCDVLEALNNKIVPHIIVINSLNDHKIENVDLIGASSNKKISNFNFMILKMYFLISLTFIRSVVFIETTT